MPIELTKEERSKLARAREMIKIMGRRRYNWWWFWVRQSLKAYDMGAPPWVVNLLGHTISSSLPTRLQFLVVDRNKSDLERKA